MKKLVPKTVVKRCLYLVGIIALAGILVYVLKLSFCVLLESQETSRVEISKSFFGTFLGAFFGVMVFILNEWIKGFLSRRRLAHESMVKIQLYLNNAMNKTNSNIASLKGLANNMDRTIKSKPKIVMHLFPFEPYERFPDDYRFFMNQEVLNECFKMEMKLAQQNVDLNQTLEAKAKIENLIETRADIEFEQLLRPGIDRINEVIPHLETIKYEIFDIIATLRFLMNNKPSSLWFSLWIHRFLNVDISSEYVVEQKKQMAAELKDNFNLSLERIREMYSRSRSRKP